MISFEFFGILILSVVLYWIIPRQSLRNLLLILASFAFIYLLDQWSIAVVAGLSLVSYFFGILIEKHPKRSLIHACGVVFVLGVLIAFKYLGFLSGIFNSLAGFINALPQFEIRKLLLPLGISYIVFKHISYLTDIKWGLIKPGRFIDFLLYSSLFTIFVAGPIERFENFKPQVEQSRLPFSWCNIDYGFMRIVFGMFKKLILADWIGYFISPIWENLHHYGQWIRLLALLGYSFQIYFDFAGYSDIAIGSSRLFGIKIMENFNNPYLAPNISQFWRRWHISLSNWIKDYLFFPLSKISNKRLWQIFFVPVIAMALCGLWHGASWHFMLWGLWHGLGLSALQIWNQYKRKHKQLGKATKSKWFNYAGIAMNFCFVTLGWWWFR
ncbi:MAG: hypothetical protein PHH43_01875 [Candidatus Cloacimonetes bacterium]|nr:hypothetical protein [Candidatus Cloacimonadota bacterium]